MTKYFVLRPHALLSSYNSLLRFGSDNVIVVPLAVIDEIQAIRDLSLEKAKIRKHILKYLLNARIHSDSEGNFKQENGSILRIEMNCKEFMIDVPNISEFQKRTLQVCKSLMAEGKNVVLITNNYSLQIKAYNLGVKAEEFKDEIFPELSQQYTGRMEVPVSQGIIDELYKNNEVEISSIYHHSQYEWIENCYVVLMLDGPSGVYAKVKGNKLVLANAYTKHKPYGVTAQTDGQRMMLDALYSEDVPMVVVKGTAGTGKTFITLATALDKLENKEYSRIMASSRVFNETLGYLPGDVKEKVQPFIQGLMTNLEELVQGRNQERDYSKKQYEDGSYYFERGMIQIIALNTLRGCTLLDKFVIIDEVQNIEPEDMKTIVTRLGKKSKLILLGDPTQIDDQHLSERYNGITYVAEKFKGHPLCAVISMGDDESVRSDLAREASKIL